MANFEAKDVDGLLLTGASQDHFVGFHHLTILSRGFKVFQGVSRFFLGVSRGFKGFDGFQGNKGVLRGF